MEVVITLRAKIPLVAVAMNVGGRVYVHANNINRTAQELVNYEEDI